MTTLALLAVMPVGEQTLQPSPPVALRAAAVGGLMLGASRLYYLVLRIVYLYLLVEFVGLTAYGYLTYAQGWYILLGPVVAWGTNELIISGLLRRSGRDQDAFAGTSLALRLVLAVAVMLLIAVLAVVTEERTDLRLLIVIYSQAVLSRGLAAWYYAMFTARGRGGEWVWLSALFMTLEVLAVLWIVRAGASLVDIALVQSLVWWLAAATKALWYTRRFGWVTPRLQGELVRWFLRVGAAVGLGTALLLFFSSGILLAYRFLARDLSQLGEAALALQVLVILQQMLTVALNALLPALRPPGSGVAGNVGRFAAVAVGTSLGAGAVAALALQQMLPLALDHLSLPALDAPLRLFAGAAWVLVPLLVVQSLRIAQIALGATDAFLVCAVVGAVAALSCLFLVAANAVLTAPAALNAAGIGLATVCLAQLVSLRRAMASARMP